MAKKGWKIIRNVAIGILAFILVLLVALQILLRPSVLTGLVNKYAPQFTEGNIEFSRIRTRLVESFPYASVEAEDLSITYPHERYARFDSVYPPSGSRFSLMKAGNQRGVENGTDTLASARRVFVSLNYVNLAKGQIDIRSVELERPRIFAHYFDSTAANWDIFPSGGEEEDTTSSGMADIKLHKVSLTGKPFIVYTNPVDTVHLALRAKSLELDGKLPLADIWKTNATLDVDSLFVSGRLPADTLALGLTNLDVDAAKRRVKLDASATAMLRTNSFGRLRVPIRLDGDATFPKAAEGEFAANVHSLTVGLSALEVKAKGDLLSHREGLDMDVDASIEDCPLGDLIKEYRNNIPFLKKIDTDAIISLDAHAEGTLSKEEMPAINAKLFRKAWWTSRALAVVASLPLTQRLLRTTIPVWTLPCTS